jgi:hypothetical protein
MSLTEVQGYCSASQAAFMLGCSLPTVYESLDAVPGTALYRWADVFELALGSVTESERAR